MNHNAINAILDMLSGEELRALKSTPVLAFPPGSNMWPFVVNTAVEPAIDGEVYDGLLRRGYLKAEELPKPIMSDRSPDPEVIPDCEVTHEVTLTALGSALMTALLRAEIGT